MSRYRGSENSDRSAAPKRNSRSRRTVTALLDAVLDVLAEAPYSELTVRSAAARAGVSATTAYTYFPSKESLVAEVYLRALDDVETFTDINWTVEERVQTQLRAILNHPRGHPRLADACLSALMSDDESVIDVRDRIAGRISGLLTYAWGPTADRRMVELMHMVLSGALLHARSVPASAIAEDLDLAVHLILRPDPEPSGPRKGQET